ncbi:MAG: hypothetical protein HY319_29695 [Armatimonadetes bacterium]|nr:hypothetical protein [Armatimonadota bacterium]
MNADIEGARLRELWTGHRRTTPQNKQRITIVAHRRGEPEPLVLTALRLGSRQIEFHTADPVETGDRLELRLALAPELTVATTGRVARLEKEGAFRSGLLVFDGAAAQFQALCEFLRRIA